MILKMVIMHQKFMALDWNLISVCNISFFQYSLGGVNGLRGGINLLAKLKIQ